MPDFFLDDFDLDADAAAKSLKEGKITQTATPSSSSASTGSVSKVFDKIKTLLAPELIDNVKATYQFELKGADAGSWFVDLKNSPGQVVEGAPTSADCTMTLSSDDFLALFGGKLKATDAFFGGKLKIKGNMGAAMKLEKLMKQMAKAKL